MKTGDHKILAGLILASIHINLFHVVLLPPCIGFLVLYIGILQKERQAGFFQMDVKEMRVYRAAGAALVLVTAFSSFLSMFWRRPDGTIWSLIHSELCCGYAMVMGAALCGYAVSLILHIALWQLFASMIILVCRFMVVMVVIGAKKEA